MTIRFVAALALISLAFAGTSKPAAAYVQSVHVVNGTQKCAWITVYYAQTGLTSWNILSQPGQQPGSLGPQEARTFQMRVPSQHMPEEVKVRAEVNSSFKCDRSKIFDTADERRSGNTSVSDSFTARLWYRGPGNHNTYQMWFQ